MAEPSADTRDLQVPADPDPSPAPPGPAFGKIRTGLSLFVVVSLLGNLVAIWWKRPEGLSDLVAHTNWWLAALVIPLVAVDHVLGGLRYRVLFNGRVLPRVSLWNCMRSNYGNLFMGMVTPAQTGGGAAQIYLLWRSGATVGDGMMASLVNFAATLVFFLVGAVTALFLLPDNLIDPRLTGLFRAGFVLLAGLVLLVFGLLQLPQVFLGLIGKLFNLVPRRWARLRRGCEGVLVRLEVEVQGFRAALQKLWRLQPGLMPVVFVLTIALFMNKYLIGYVIASALQTGVPFWIFISLQICQLFLISFAPTPGASGVAELTSVWMLAAILAEQNLVVYTLAWRLTTSVLGAVIGAGVLLQDIRRGKEYGAKK